MKGNQSDGILASAFKLNMGDCICLLLNEDDFYEVRTFFKSTIGNFFPEIGKKVT